MKEDVEDLIVLKGKIKSIGTKQKKLPKFQYMGILKLNKKLFKNQKSFIKK